MAHFQEKPGTRSAFWYLRNSFPDITAFEAVIRSLVLSNPLGCTSYMKAGRNHPPIEKVREQYTAKFVYGDTQGKQAGNGLDMYPSVEGYQYGIAAVLSNMANVAAHGGKARHDPDNDHFSVTLKCHDPEKGMYFLHISRERLTVSSFADDTILERVRTWAEGIPALEGSSAPSARRRGRPRLRRRTAGDQSIP